jgi:hypothetical protein
VKATTYSVKIQNQLRIVKNENQQWKNIIPALNDMK